MQIQTAVLLYVNITWDHWLVTYFTHKTCDLTCSLQQRSVIGIITARDLKFSAADQPKGWWDHISVHGWIGCCSHGNKLVIPPVTSVIHPVLVVIVGEAGNETPSFSVWWHVTIGLPWNYVVIDFSNNVLLGSNYRFIVLIINTAGTANIFIIRRKGGGLTSDLKLGGLKRLFS